MGKTAAAAAMWHADWFADADCDAEEGFGVRMLLVVLLLRRGEWNAASHAIGAAAGSLGAAVE